MRRLYSAYEVKKEKADGYFLWWLLRSNTFKEILTRSLPGGIKTELKAKRFLPIEVPLPHIDEQRRIVAEIDRLAGKIKRVQQLHKASLKQTEALFRSIIGSNSKKIDKFGVLSDVCIGKPRNGWSARCDNADDGIPVLTLSAVTGYNYDGTAIKRTSLPVNPEAHYWLHFEDLLITRSNSPELVGHAAIYDGKPSPCIYPDLMMKLIINEKKADKQFVWYWLQSPMVRQYIKAKAKGTSPTMKKISQGTVMNIPFPTKLSLEQQRDMAKRYRMYKTKLFEISKLQNKSASVSSVLLPSILDRAFKGEL